MLWDEIRGYPPLPAAIVNLYLHNNLFAMLVDFGVALFVLWLAGLLVKPLRGRLRGWRLWLARTLVASVIVLVHEYMRVGYFFKLSDLPHFPPRTHESFLAFLLALAALLARLAA